MPHYTTPHHSTPHHTAPWLLLLWLLLPAGAHYDLGRQDFVFSNQKISNAFNECVTHTHTMLSCLLLCLHVLHSLQTAATPVVLTAGWWWSLLHVDMSESAGWHQAVVAFPLPQK